MNIVKCALCNQEIDIDEEKFDKFLDIEFYTLHIYHPVCFFFFKRIYGCFGKLKLQ